MGFSKLSVFALLALRAASVFAADAVSQLLLMSSLLPLAGALSIASRNIPLKLQH